MDSCPLATFLCTCAQPPPPLRIQPPSQPPTRDLDLLQRSVIFIHLQQQWQGGGPFQHTDDTCDCPCLVAWLYYTCLASCTTHAPLHMYRACLPGCMHILHKHMYYTCTTHACLVACTHCTHLYYTCTTHACLVACMYYTHVYYMYTCLPGCMHVIHMHHTRGCLYCTCSRSMAVRTSRPPTTRANTVCLKSRCRQLLKAMKNWLPLVSLPGVHTRRHKSTGVQGLG